MTRPAGLPARAAVATSGQRLDPTLDRRGWGDAADACQTCLRLAWATATAHRERPLAGTLLATLRVGAALCDGVSSASPGARGGAAARRPPAGSDHRDGVRRPELRDPASDREDRGGSGRCRRARTQGRASLSSHRSSRAGLGFQAAGPGGGIKRRCLTRADTDAAPSRPCSVTTARRADQCFDDPRSGRRFLRWRSEHFARPPLLCRPQAQAAPATPGPAGRRRAPARRPDAAHS